MLPLKKISSYLRLILNLYFGMVLGSHSAYALSSVQDGLWSNPATWGGVLPNPSDDIVIAHEVILNFSSSANSLEITLNGSLICLGAPLSINGNSLINGSFSSTGTFSLIDFNGNIDIGSSGEFLVGGIANIEFSGNIQNAGVFDLNMEGNIRFNAPSNQSINPISPLSFNGFVLNIQTELLILDGANVLFLPNEIQLNASLRNQNQSNLRIRGNLTGASTLINEENARLEYQGDNTPLPSLNCSANGNTFIYRSASAQAIAASTYFNLSIQNTGAIASLRGLGGNTNVSGNFRLLQGIQAETGFNSGAFNIEIGGQLILENGTLWEDNAPLGTQTFNGLVDIQAGARFVPSSSSNYVFRGGIQNQGLLEIPTSSAILLDGNNQALNPLSPIALLGDCEIRQSLDILNGAAVDFGRVTLQGRLVNLNQNAFTIQGEAITSGGNAEFVNSPNCRVYFQGTNAPLDGAQLDFSGLNNEVYYSRTLAGGNQVLQSASYYHLVIDGLGVKSMNSNVNVLGDLILLSSLDLGSGNHQLSLQGNLSNQGQFIPQNGEIRFVGPQDQRIISTNGGLNFFNAALNKPSGSFENLCPIVLSGTLSLAQGFWQSTDLNPLRILGGAQIQGGSPSAYIAGPLIKDGNESFTFPLGKSGFYAPVELFNATANYSIQAEYFHQSPPNANVINPDLVFISEVEYWELSALSPSSASLKVTWPEGSQSGITDLSDLRLARYQGSFWEEVPAQSSGTPTQGSMSTEANLNNWGVFTLASADGENPLGNPIEDLIPIAPNLIEVLVQESGNIRLEWEDRAFQEKTYEVERSTDHGQTYTLLQVLERNSTEFIDTQVELGNTYFYRVRALNSFGSSEYSASLGALSAIISALSGNPLSLEKVYPNPNPGRFYLNAAQSFPELQAWSLRDSQGKSLSFQVFREANQLIFQVEPLSSGLYFLEYRGQKVFRQKIQIDF